MGIKSIRIQNFKSIKDSGFVELKPFNVLIGANGVGKSNFISFFKFLNKIYNQELQLYVAQNGRADSFFFFGRKTSKFIEGQLQFGNEYKNAYEFTLIPDQAGNFIFLQEWSNTIQGKLKINSGGEQESSLKKHSWNRSVFLRNNIDSLKIFHFHDTSANAAVKQPSNAQDYAYLHDDGGNLAAFLYRLQETNPTILGVIEKVRLSQNLAFETASFFIH